MDVKFYSSDILSEDFLRKYTKKTVPWGFNGLGFLVYKRTYARVKENGQTEDWWETIARCINGAQKIGAKYTKQEAEKLYDLIFNLKCNYPGRMLWQLGTSTVDRFGGNSLLNCWFVTMNEPKAFEFLFENLMLGGGVGFSVKREHINELPRIKRGIKIEHQDTKDADLIVPDSRTGWIRLLHYVLKSFFNNGKSFTYSTILVRGAGEPIKGFGGTASGPRILIDGITTICEICKSREGKKLRSIDVLDICNAIGSIVIAGNVRRSAEIAIGDPDDYLYLRAKRWDLGNIPNHRVMSNNTVCCDDFGQISQDIWDGYMGNGEPYGLFNLPLSRKMGRLGESAHDDCEGLNPCVSGDTEILTDKGYYKIQDLVGAETNIWNGFEWSLVVPKITAYNQEMLKIKFSDGRYLKCTPYHNFEISISYWGESVTKRAVDLKINDKIVKHDFPVMRDGESFEHAYTQGFISGDGMDDYDIVWLYEPKFCCIEKLSGGYMQDAEFSTFTGVKRKIFKLEFNQLPKDFVPIKWDLNSKLKWLAGLLDSDGTELKEGGAQIVSVNGQFLRDLQKMLSTCGIQSKVIHACDEGFRKMPDGKGGEKDYLCKSSERICIGAKQIQSLINLGMECSRLKFNKFPNRDASQFVRVVGIEKVDNCEKVYCFNEPKRHFGIFNGILTRQCGEITLGNYECCNLAELYLNNISSQEELITCAKLLYKTQKAISALKFIHEETNEVVHKNMRLGLSVTGICQSLDKICWLDNCYKELKKFDAEWSKENNWPKSIKLTTVKPSGTVSLLAGSTPGVHPAFSEYYTRRVRIASNDKLVDFCRKSGYKIEYQQKLDGTEDRSTMVVEFPCKSSEGAILAKNMSAVKQLEIVKQIQTVWADNAVSVTVYYKKEELPEIKKWLNENYKTSIKSVSFLLHAEGDHGFKQAPYSEIADYEYNSAIKNIKQIAHENDYNGGGILDSLECAGGACPIK